MTEAHKSVGNSHGKNASKSIDKKELEMAIKVRETRTRACMMERRCLTVLSSTDMLTFVSFTPGVPLPLYNPVRPSLLPLSYSLRIVSPPTCSPCTNAHTPVTQVWNNYLSNKKQIEDHFAKHDTNNSGKLELDQVMRGLSPVLARCCLSVDLRARFLASICARRMCTSGMYVCALPQGLSCP